MSVPLDNETVLDPPFMRPKIEYQTNKENAPHAAARLFPACSRRICPTAKAGRSSTCSSTTHNGTHMDAPYHFQSQDDPTASA